MAKVAMMSSGLRRKPTYEEVISYIENDPDKVKYPNRAAKFLRSTFQLSQLDGMGQALLEQQQVEEMKERLKDFQIHQLALQNDTDARTQRAIGRNEPLQMIEEPSRGRPGRDEQPEAQRGSSSSGLVRNVIGGVIGGVGNMARGVGSLLLGGHPAKEQYYTPGGTQPGTPVQSEQDEAVADYEDNTISEASEQESRKSQKPNRRAGL